MLRNEWLLLLVFPVTKQKDKFSLLKITWLRYDTFSKKNTFVFFIFDVLIVPSDSTFMLVIIKK